ncbi:MAG: response regulator [Pseudomonadota bacterium]|nr:response regulator [Pseudomonadota bacterium]
MKSSANRVLLVEDSVIVAERLIEVLRNVPEVNLVGTVDTEKAAIECLRREPTDIVILDLHLKQGTGFGVLRALAGMQIQPRVIVLTNYDLPEYMHASLSLGAAHFLDKARDLLRLPEIMRDIVTQGRVRVGAETSAIEH